MTEQEAYRIVLAQITSEVQKEGEGFAVQLEASSFQGRTFFMWAVSSPTPCTEGRPMACVYSSKWTLGGVEEWETVTHRLRETITRLKEHMNPKDL